MPEDKSSGWLKPSELAAREGVSRSTIWRWRDKGLVKDRRLAPHTGVRVRLVDDDEDD